VSADDSGDVLGTKAQASVLPHTGADNPLGLVALGAMTIAGGAGLIRAGKHRKA
jgi:LPXTG-motif cell wall-anchored protein